MSTSVARTTAALAVDVRFDDEPMHVCLSDGGTISAPLDWFPRLREATAAQRANWRLIGGGVGVHWEDIDEDISVPSLLA